MFAIADDGITFALYAAALVAAYTFTRLIERGVPAGAMAAGPLARAAIIGKFVTALLFAGLFCAWLNLLLGGPAILVSISAACGRGAIMIAAVGAAAIFADSGAVRLRARAA